MIFRLNVTLLLAAICMSGCGGSATSPSLTPQPAPDGSTTILMPGGASTLTTTAFGTNPFKIAVGTTISWLNSDTTTHTSTADGEAWTSGNIAPGARYNFTFQSAGQFTYHCQIHPGMTGTIVVQ
jgi:plastocyanin